MHNLKKSNIMKRRKYFQIILFNKGYYLCSLLFCAFKSRNALNKKRGSKKRATQDVKLSYLGDSMTTLGFGLVH